MKKLPIVAAAFLLLTYGSEWANAQNLLPGYLRSEYKVSPVTDVVAPRLSWELTSSARNQIQTAYQILVANSSSQILVNRQKATSSRELKVVSLQDDHVDLTVGSGSYEIKSTK